VIAYLQAENKVLREQLGKKRLRFTDSQRKLLAVKAKVLGGRKKLAQWASIASPETLLKWYRQLIAQKYNGSKKRGPGRPTIDTVIEKLIITIAKDNPKWGYLRLKGELKKLGHIVGRSTIRRILKRNGLEPAPRRKTTWKQFLSQQWDALFAMDFFNVEVLTLTGFVRYSVLFVIEYKTRRVHIAGIVHCPHEVWMKQMARNLTDCFEGFLLNAKYLIHDRDPLFTEAFLLMLKDSGIEPLRLPAKSPNLNPFAERFVRSIKEECLNRLILFGENHLRVAVKNYIDHYLFERPHQGLGNKVIALAAHHVSFSPAVGMTHW
jgi:transposase InsO family protein